MFNASARWRPFRASLLLRETQTWGSRPRLYDIAASRLKEMRPLERIRARRGATRRGKTEQSGRSDQNQRFVSLAVPAASGGGARLRTTSVIGHTRLVSPTARTVERSATHHRTWRSVDGLHPPRETRPRYQDRLLAGDGDVPVVPRVFLAKEQARNKFRPPDLGEFALLPDWQNHRPPRLSTRAEDSCPDK